MLFRQQEMHRRGLRVGRGEVCLLRRDRLQSGSQLLSLYPPTTYASPAVDCLVRLLAFLRSIGRIRR